MKKIDIKPFIYNFFDFHEYISKVVDYYSVLIAVIKHDQKNLRSTRLDV